MKKAMFPVAILAGGLATRLRPLTEKIPKSLIEINQEPFILHQLRLLKAQGINKLILCLGFLGEEIEALLGTGEEFGMELQYSYDGPQLLGTGGSLKKALPLLDENFFVLYGDSYLPCNFKAVQDSFVEQRKPGLMTVFRNEGQWDKSNIEFSEEVIRVYDKVKQTPAMHYIDYGLGVFNKKAFELVPDEEVYDLALLYQDLLKQQQLAAFEVSERFYEMGSLAGIEALRDYLGN